MARGGGPRGGGEDQGGEEAGEAHQGVGEGGEERQGEPGRREGLHKGDGGRLARAGDGARAVDAQGGGAAGRVVGHPRLDWLLPRHEWRRDGVRAGAQERERCVESHLRERAFVLLLCARMHVVMMM